MRYIDKFSTSGDVQTAINNGTLLKPYVAYVEASESLDWNTKEPPHDYSKDYLTFEILSAGTISILNNDGIYYSLNEGAWTKQRGDINVNAGDTVRLYSTTTNKTPQFRTSTAVYNVCGNIMSLGYGQDFVDKTTLAVGYSQMFKYCTGIISAENLVLPATTLTVECYKDMFQNATNLISGPTLPAQTLVQSAYEGMFIGCSNLQYIKCLAESGIDSNKSTYYWLGSVASSGTFVKKAGVTWPSGASGIPNNWTVVEV